MDALRRGVVCAAAAMAVLAAGCTMGPDYQRPAVELPESWRVETAGTEDLADGRWWTRFGDPTLNELVETAIRENRDVEAAAARVDRFLGALTTTRSQFFPQIGYGFDASRNR